MTSLCAHVHVCMHVCMYVHGWGCLQITMSVYENVVRQRGCCLYEKKETRMSTPIFRLVKFVGGAA